jgi:hypothetical protein
VQRNWRLRPNGEDKGDRIYNTCTQSFSKIHSHSPLERVKMKVDLTPRIEHRDAKIEHSTALVFQHKINLPNRLVLQSKLLGHVRLWINVLGDDFLSSNKNAKSKYI